MNVVVRTPAGFVGRQSIREELTGDQPIAFAYIYKEGDEADQIAARFGGEVIVL